jgi:hypothetical protein
MQLVFIIGAARSGTTLLQSMFHSHPEITSLPEVKFFPRYVVPQIRGLRCQGKTLHEIMEELEADEHLRRLDLNVRDAMEPFLSGECAFTYRDFYLYLLELHLKRAHKSVVAEKDTDNTRYIRELYAAYPDAYIVHIVRDPRDVVLSRMKTAWGAAQPFVTHLRITSRALNNACLDGPRLFGERYCVVRYENLIDHPERELCGLCERLQLPFHSDMLRFFEQADQLVATTEMTWKRNTFMPLQKENSQKWRHGLSRWQVLAIEGTCEVAFSRFGYKLSGMGRTLERRLLSLLANLGYAALRLKRRAKRLLHLPHSGTLQI